MASGAAPAPRLARAPGVLERSLLDGVLVLTPPRPPALALTGSGAALWDVLRTPCDEDELIEDLRERFDDPHDTLAADVRATVVELVAHGLVVRTTDR